MGGGPQEAELKDFVFKNNIENVIFSGFVDKHELIHQYRNCKVFILPSISEPWGLVANEAMMCGLPVILSNKCGSSFDLVQDNGYVFDPHNQKSLENNLNRFIQNENLIDELGKRSVKIISKYTTETASESFIKVLGRIGQN